MNVNQYATGIYYLGTEAKDIGLIDELGGKEKAIEVTKELANIKEAELIYYMEPENILSILNLFTAQLGLNIGKGISQTLSQPQILA